MSFWVTHFTLIFNCVRELPRWRVVGWPKKDQPRSAATSSRIPLKSKCHEQKVKAWLLATHQGFGPGAGQTRLRGRGGSNKARRFSGPAAGGCPCCGAEAGSLRFEKESARMAAKGGAGRGSAFAAGKQSMERPKASAVTPWAWFAFRQARVFAYFLRSKS